MSDEKLTKLTGAMIAAVSAQVRHLVNEGAVDPEKLKRYTPDPSPLFTP